MNLTTIEARDLPELWYLLIKELVYQASKKNMIYTIDCGSYNGQRRLEFDFVSFHVKYPNYRPLVPEINPNLGIPNPVDIEYINNYADYILTDYKPKNTVYTYGERLNGWKNSKFNIVNQVQSVIEMYKENKPNYRTNQACMEIGIPSDIYLNDPPCLRVIDTRIQDNKLHFIFYFRSWDLWNGLPCNLPALVYLQEYMADEIGVDVGEFFASSKGLHLYDHVWPCAKILVRKKEGFKFVGE